MVSIECWKDENDQCLSRANLLSLHNVHREFRCFGGGSIPKGKTVVNFKGILVTY